MDNIGSREIVVVDDLESGDTASADEDERKQEGRDEVAGQNESLILRGKRTTNVQSKSSCNSDEGVEILAGVGDARAEAGQDSTARETPGGGEKKKSSNSKRPPKPPRPAGGPSLNDADIKLIRQISELSRLRRARSERIKALQKMRSDKASSSTGNVFAMIVTLVFICVIILQGILGSHV